ncbi:helix-turn-helix domain-containing protein [Accumulibacter sp.]|uniref:helix-turn-helix domain-containing protein n=1 Tax=Accumulibacter sp. TaxID=2053492 RepID=UPI0025DA9070|nr:helix-turn-helix domain-containing protein [Accumulibacter sp.]MCM8641536.1 helix-turn-helix domain-containing protein [Accumulibacter sp.]
MNSPLMPQRPVFTSKRMEQQWVRMQGVKMMRAGMPASHVAHHLDVSVRAVFKWIAAFYDGGQNALLAREGAGRPPKVTPEQLRWIADTVRDRTPDQLKFEFGLWTLRLIGSLIERQFQMTLSLPTLGKVMRPEADPLWARQVWTVSTRNEPRHTGSGKKQIAIQFYLRPPAD